MYKRFIQNSLEPFPPLPDASIHSMTVEEASTLMLAKQCKFYSPRKVQRLCRDGFVDCQKLSTTRNGQPVTEWLINETSLRNRIEEREPRLDDCDATEAPNSSGDASSSEEAKEYESSEPNDLALPDQSGDANSNDESRNKPKNKRDDDAAPEPDGDAIFIEPSKAELMIENARLTAELEGNRALVAEILDEKGFLREELRDAREGRKDVTKIAERTLEALETMALGGKLNHLSNQENQTPEQTRSFVQATNSAETPAKHIPVQTGDIPNDNFERFRI